jgi:curved DNA-binding protein CbpA
MRRQTDEPDHYAVLGVATEATEAEISRAFRRQAFVHHPDRGGDADAFRDLYRARETLLDPRRRAAYDQRRRVPDPPPPADPPPDVADPFEWVAGAGPSTDDRSGRHYDPFPAYQTGYSWRRSDRFAWWKPDPPPQPRRRRGRR